MPDRCANPVKKRTSGISDKKANPDFFRKLDGVRDSIDWRLDIDVPRDSPQEGSPRAGAASCENLVHHGVYTDSMLGSGATPPPSSCGGGETLEVTTFKIHGGDVHFEQDEVGELNQPEGNGEIPSNGCPDGKTVDTLEIPVTWEDPQANEPQNGEYGPQSDAQGSTMNAAEKTALDMISIHRHFHSLERQQLSMMELSDLVSSKGPNALGLMGETKKELLFAVQEATSMDYAQSWMGAKLTELAEHLGNAWS